MKAPGLGNDLKQILAHLVAEVVRGIGHKAETIRGVGGKLEGVDAPPPARIAEVLSDACANLVQGLGLFRVREHRGLQLTT
jgi:hypothetical protein